MSGRGWNFLFKVCRFLPYRVERKLIHEDVFRNYLKKRDWMTDDLDFDSLVFKASFMRCSPASRDNWIIRRTDANLYKFQYYSGDVPLDTIEDTHSLEYVELFLQIVWLFTRNWHRSWACNMDMLRVTNECSLSVLCPAVKLNVFYGHQLPVNFTQFQDFLMFVFVRKIDSTMMYSYLNQRDYEKR